MGKLQINIDIATSADAAALINELQAKTDAKIHATYMEVLNAVE